MLNNIKKLQFIIIIIIIFVIVFIFMILRENIIFRNLAIKARIEYENSRIDPSWEPESYEFLTQGIFYNMTEKEVNSIMQNASEKYYHLSSERRSIYEAPVKWNGYVNLYFFEYGNKYYNPFTKREADLFNEKYVIYFDPKGLTKKIRRSIFQRDGKVNKTLEIDLKYKSIKK